MKQREPHFAWIFNNNTLRATYFFSSAKILRVKFSAKILWEIYDYEVLLGCGFWLAGLKNTSNFNHFVSHKIGTLRDKTGHNRASKPAFCLFEPCGKCDTFPDAYCHDSRDLFLSEI